MRHEHGQRLWFDISEVPEDNYLMMAELRIYQNPSDGKWATSDKEYTLSVYYIKTHNEINSEFEVISSTNTTADYQGWLELNVTEGLNNWLSHRNEYKGFYIGAYSANKPTREIKLDDIGLIHLKEEGQYQPFMIGFFKGSEVRSTYICCFNFNFEQKFLAY